MSSIIIEEENPELDSQESVDDTPEDTLDVEPVVDHYESVETEEETQATTSTATPVRRKVQTASTTLPTPSRPNMKILRNEKQNKKWKNIQESNLMEIITETWGKFDNVLKQRSNENIIEDPDMMFGKMVGHELSTISDADKKFFAKQEISKILYEANKV